MEKDEKKETRQKKRECQSISFFLSLFICTLWECVRRKGGRNLNSWPAFLMYIPLAILSQDCAVEILQWILLSGFK